MRSHDFSHPPDSHVVSLRQRAPGPTPRRVARTTAPHARVHAIPALASCRGVPTTQSELRGMSHRGELLRRGGPLSALPESGPCLAWVARRYRARQNAPIPRGITSYPPGIPSPNQNSTRLPSSPARLPGARPGNLVAWHGTEYRRALGRRRRTRCCRSPGASRPGSPTHTNRVTKPGSSDYGLVHGTP